MQHFQGKVSRADMKFFRGHGTLKISGMSLNIQKCREASNLVHSWAYPFSVHKMADGTNYKNQYGNFISEQWDLSRQFTAITVTLFKTRSQAVARIADRTAKNCTGHVT